MSRDKDIRKSNFVAQTSMVNSTDFLDFVRNGQNFRISMPNFITALGVTGSLTAVGDATAIPVFYLNGTVNNIRGIIGGSGVTASISSGDAVEVAHNFTVDKTGAPVLANETAVSPTIRSIVGGTGITVAAAGNIIQISESGSPGSTKTVLVYQKSDLPTPAGGVITLADDTEYLFVNDVSVGTDRFAVGAGTVVSGSDGSLITLTYTGAATMFTSADKDWKMKDIILTCASGTVFDVSSTTGAHIFRYYNGRINCLNAGNFDDMQLVFFYSQVFVCTGTGFTFTGSSGDTVLFDTCNMVIPSGTGTGFELGTATFNSFSLNKILFNISSTGDCIAGAAASANINTAGLGTVINCQQNGTADVLDGNISPYDNRWQMALNPDIIDSTDVCLCTHAGATITIAASNTPVIVGATWTEQTAHRFTTTSGGRFTYTGKGAQHSFTASISVDLVSGVDDISFFLYKNGVQITASRITREVDSGNIGNLSLLWQDEAETDDYYELWVQNDDTSVNVIISNIVLRITS